MKNWDYANLSRLASRSGGPERFMRGLKHAGICIGRKQMFPFVAGGVGAGLAVGIVGTAVYYRKTQELDKQTDAISDLIANEITKRSAEEKASKLTDEELDDLIDKLAKYLHDTQNPTVDPDEVDDAEHRLD